jgi:hypothetical protein
MMPTKSFDDFYEKYTSDPERRVAIEQAESKLAAEVQNSK